MISSFTLWAFPFAHYFEADFLLSTDYANKSRIDQSFAFDVAQKVDMLESKVNDYYSSVAIVDHIRHWKRFKGTGGNGASDLAPIDSFYIWRNNDRRIIERLLKGERLVLTPRAEAGRSPADMDAIKFKTLKMDFKSEDRALEAELVQQLNANFSISMTHFGDSHFLCSGKVRVGRSTH